MEENLSNSQKFLAIYNEIVNPKNIIKKKLYFMSCRYFSLGCTAKNDVFSLRHKPLCLLFWLQGPCPSVKVSCVLTLLERGRSYGDRCTSFTFSG